MTWGEFRDIRAVLSYYLQKFFFKSANNKRKNLTIGLAVDSSPILEHLFSNSPTEWSDRSQIPVLISPAHFCAGSWIPPLVFLLMPATSDFLMLHFRNYSLLAWMKFVLKLHTVDDALDFIQFFHIKHYKISYFQPILYMSMRNKCP